VTCDETHSAAPEGLPQMYPWCVMRRSLPDFTIGGGIRELTAGTAAAQLLMPISVQHGRSAIPPEPQPFRVHPGIPHPAVVSCLVNRVVLQTAMSHFALFPRGSTMATAVTNPSFLTVESTPLLVDATAADALCGKHLPTWRACWATGPQGESQSRSDMGVH
jgi:hypothetical protein